MGAKKPVVNTTKKPRVLEKMKTRLRTTANVRKSKITSSKSRATAVKLDVNKPSTIESSQKAQTTLKATAIKTSKASSCLGIAQSSSPKKSSMRHKPSDDKSKAIKKIIKSLDIKISGFKSIAPDEQKVECKASISEIVKTKSRAASAKISPGPLGKTNRKEEDVSKKGAGLGKIVNDSSEEGVKKQETKDTKLELDELKKERKGKCKEHNEILENSSSPKDIPSKTVSTKVKDDNTIKPPKAFEMKQQQLKIMKQINRTKPDEVRAKPKTIPKHTKIVEKAPSYKKEEAKPIEKIAGKPVEKKESKKPKESLNLEKVIASHDKNSDEPPKVITIKGRSKTKPKPKEKSEVHSGISAGPNSNPTDTDFKIEDKIKVISRSSSKIPPETERVKKPEETSTELATITSIQIAVKEPTEVENKKTVIPSQKSDIITTKLLSVRERLQKKYVRDKGSTFKAYKSNKQVKEVEIPVDSTTKKPEETQLQEATLVKKTSNCTKHAKDIYDFKTESESEDNIKMNLLSELAVLSKIHLEKDKESSKDKKIEDRIKNSKEMMGHDKDKDFSDEDDRPLQQTKKLIEDEEDEDEKPLSQCMELKPMAIKVKEEVKIETKKAVKTTTKSSKPKPAKKPPPKRKVRIESSNSNSDYSGSEDSDDSSSESCLSFGPKRHRIASLNALAKVQCLYENESRTAHELGLSKSSQIPRIRIIASSSSSDDEENAAKKRKDGEPKEISEKEEHSAPEEENKRELRNAPGLRGMGKHWDFNDGSSFESGHESDITFRRYNDDKAKNKKRKIVKAKAAAKPKKAPTVKTPKKKPRVVSPKFTDSSDDDEKSSSANHPMDTNPNKKRKRDEVIVKTTLASKRMASLNASAIVAATYEVERHLDRNLDSDCSSFESFPEEIKLEPNKKLKDSIKPDPAEEANKESSRPTSSSVVIVQDTDVTITGVYVNATTGSSQEAYCKMQYRVQSSVTEERVLRPSSSDPPKSYTPLGALSSMRPPGAAGGPVMSVDDITPQQHQPLQPAILSHEPLLPPHQSNAHIYTAPLPQHHHHHPQPISQEQMHHLHHQQPSPKYHHMHHHHHHQQPQLVQPRCESPLRYPPGAYQNVQPPMPPPPNSISISSGSSAFCAPMQQPHHDLSGYYQPAGPLISPHVLPVVPPSNAALVSAKQIPSPLDSEPDQLQQPPQSTSTAESSDSEVLITGGDLATFRYPSQQQQSQQQSQSLASLSVAQQQQHQQQQQQQQQNSPYSRSIHPMHYTPAYPPSYYSPYPGDAMCYAPPYQPYFAAKVYQTAPTYRRYPSYYQSGPPPPSELYDPPPQPSNAPQSLPQQSGSQLVPTGPSGPQHIEHYPGPPGFYSGYNPGGGQCYSRGMQPPYMEYPAPCPCPMQSCPKNVLTGPLIGSNSSGSSNNTNSSNSTSNILTSNSSSSNISITNTNNNINNNSSSLNNLSQQLKTSKGPVKTHSHLMGQHEPLTSSNLSNGQTILSKSHHHHHHLHQCKMEVIEPIKSDLKDNLISDTIISNENRKTGQYEETVVPPTPPSSYDDNDKFIEPEARLSPSRGSTGLSTVPDQTENAAVQAQVPLGPSNLSQTAIKLTESETNGINMPSAIGRKARIGKSMAREMMYGAHAMHHRPHQHPQIFNSHQHLHHHPPSHITSTDASKPKLPEPPIIPIAIKPDLDRIKKEEIKVEEEDDVVILEDEVKLIKSEPEILEILDKSSDLEEVTECNEIDKDKDDSILQPNSKRIKILDNKSQCKKSSPNGYKSLIKQTEPKPYLCLSRKSDKKNHFRKYSRLGSKNGIRKRKLMLTDQQKKRLSIRKRKLIMLEKRRQAASLAKTLAKAATSSDEDNQQVDTSSKLLLEKRNSRTDYSNDTRGYFSEPDIRSSSSRKTKKTRSNEARSKSETKKSRVKITTDRLHQSEKSNKTPKLPENSSNSSSEELTLKTFKKTSKNCKLKSKEEVAITSHEDFIQPVIEPPRATPVLPNTLTNNNNFYEHNNNKTLEFPNASASATCRVPISSTWNVKRPRPRGSKFGNKKRPKYRHYQTEVDDSIIPRKSNAVPKWNNGWSWNGDPFQGKVFLNSDDPLVIRTCYPAMQHSEGDVIRPRDCVLLRAGSKKNELPYVAKVAHLWENPEDGEMMMSLLWYYRPEHTEQGRQTNDCPDEVFASRHRDHNSVACIEDKCYVLTFSEYCRYRRRVRAAEEGIEQNHLVPLLKTFSNIPRVPVTTNPEQVMFCQRVYEFRLKRLMKTPTS